MDFSNTLVVCNFIFPYYGNVEFVRALYKFPHIVFYGDERWPTPDGVIPYNESEGAADLYEPFAGGFYAYRSLMDAIERYPGYDGYFFMMDDVLVLPKCLEKLDSNAIYFSHTKSNNHCDLDDPQSNWHWWNHEFGLAACKRLRTFIPDHYLNNLSKFTGSKNIFMGGANDAFYLPGCLAQEFMELFTVFSRERVFTEIAVPSGLAMLQPESKDIGIKYLWNQGSINGRESWPRYVVQGNSNGVHPVKFSRKWTRVQVKALQLLGKFQV